MSKPATTTPTEAPCSRCPSDKAHAGVVGKEDAPPNGRRGVLGALAAVPAALFALLPSFTCPACLAAYTGVLSSLGLGFLLNDSVLAPLIAVFLLLGIVSVARATRSHKRRGPLAATVVASVLIVVGRLIWNIQPMLYAGAGILIAASIWNLWLKRPKRRSASPVAALAE